MRTRATVIAALAVLALALAACAAPSARPSDPAPQTPAAQPEPTPADPVAEESDNAVETIFIAPELKDCTGVGPMRCMQVAASAEGPWTLFYNQIEGFTFEEGFAYELKVRKEQIANPPADGSSLRYILVEVVSKSAAPAGEASELAGTKWTLAELDGAAPVAEGRPAEIEFLAEGRLAGSAGCNRLMGSYSASGGALSAGPFASTMMACPEPLMNQEQLFVQIMERAAGYSIVDDTLTVTADDGRTIVFTRA